MMDWQATQQEVHQWATHNFGDTKPWQPLLGLVEEVGEYYAAHEATGLADATTRKAAMVDAIGDQVIYAMNLCELIGVGLHQDILMWCGACPRTERELLGALAMCSRAVLKNHQGIRKVDNHTLGSMVSIGLTVWAGWVNYEIIHNNLPPLDLIVEAIWGQVRRRDWRAHPDDAHRVASEKQAD